MINQKNYSIKEKIMMFLGILPFMDSMVDKKIIRPDLYFSPLFKRHTLQTIIKHYGGSDGHLINKATGALGYGFIHYAFVSAIRPSRILCVGSQQGYIPAICALACKDNRHGHVDFVDAGKNSGESGNWGGTGFWKQHDPKQHFSVLGLDARITPYITTTKQFAKKVKKRNWDYIYIDGDHSYQGVKTDYQLFWPKLSEDGLMSLHDVTLKGTYGGEEFGAWKLWQEIKSDHKFYIGSGGASLGFIKKVS